MSEEDQELARLLANIKRDEREGVAYPKIYDKNGKQVLKFIRQHSPSS
ncbi:hypothetical protein LCGC14_3052660 [marine sediment metagenome]|uniref:Uncharacterized protein n=1 Tax=marine sediment metagenome TaxID=412755 RepID=A0A0F8WL68_9ZZZZ